MNLVRDASDLVRLIKRIVKETIENDKPTRVMYGKVTSTNPLKVTVEQRLPLGNKQLVLSDHLSRKTTNVSVPDWYRDSNGDITVGQREVQVVIDNRLKVNDKVMLLREQGGQKFVILDKVVSA